jgi:thiamine biosynthesis lipoprotein
VTGSGPGREPPATNAPRRAWVEQIMGMPISVHLRGSSVGGAAAAAAVAAVFADLRVVDAVFSTYRADSDVMRLNRGEVDLAGCHIDVGEVVELCDLARLRTGGVFDPELPAPDGGTWFDPSGLVKGWAVERAAAHLTALTGPEGLDFCLNAGGDVIAGTATDDSPAWRVGIEDPADLSRILCVLPLRTGGVATSGSAHRGAHIVDPRTGAPASALMAATVTGPSLMWADVYATAAVVRGADALEWLDSLAGYEGLVVSPDGQAFATPGFPVTAS